MKKYYIIVINTDDENEFATQEHFTEDETAESIAEIVRQAVGFNGQLRFQASDSYIVIEAASDEGYMYYVYDSLEAYENDEESIDGGQCTGTLSSAIEMAIN